MNISPFTDTPFGDEDAFSDFQLVHGLSHDKIAAVMYAQDLTYTTYPLMDSPDYDRDWLLTHQEEHQSIFNRLGLSGLPDLATVDLKKEGEYSDWMFLHQQVHQAINAALGITS